MPSICQDTVFKAFCHLISQTRQAHTWELVLCNQAYPDPKELLCDVHFSSIIAQTEPGTNVNYAQIRDDSAQIGGTPDQRLRTAKLCNDLENAHRNYVQARACVEGYSLYNKMVDRFYRKVTDHDFQLFVASNNSIRAQVVWPNYEAIKELHRVKLNNWLRELQRCTSIIYEIKNSTSTKQFLFQLEALRQARTRQAMHATQASAPAQKSALTVAERKRAIERRNRIMQRARQRANEDLRLENKHNVHQLGEQGLHPNSDLVNSRISQMLTRFKDRQIDIQPGELYWYKQLLEESGMKAPLVELALEEAKAALEANARVDMSEHLIFNEGFSNIAHTVRDFEEEDDEEEEEEEDEDDEDG